MRNTPCGVGARGEDGDHRRMWAATESQLLTDLLSAGLQQVPQMLHQLGKGGSVGGTVQPAVQHDLISTEEGRFKPGCCDGACSCSCSCSGPPHLHLSGGVFWGPHPRSLLKPPAERLVDANARIRRSTCRRKKEVICRKHSPLGRLVSLAIADRERRSPTGEPRRTRRRSAWCRPDQRWSREPST